MFGPTGYLRKGTRDISPCGLDRGVSGTVGCEVVVWKKSWFSQKTASSMLTSQRRTLLAQFTSNFSTKKLDGSILSRATL